MSRAVDLKLLCAFYVRCLVPNTTVCITPPWGDFPWSMSPQLEWCRCLKQSALETCRQELSEDVSFGIATIIGTVLALLAPSWHYCYYCDYCQYYYCHYFWHYWHPLGTIVVIATIATIAIATIFGTFGTLLALLLLLPILPLLPLPLFLALLAPPCCRAIGLGKPRQGGVIM